MNNISKEHGQRLYWLGRYAERFFTTLKSLERLYDKVIDRDPEHYKKYLECFGLPDTYGDYQSFFRSFIFDAENSCSAAFSLQRAYDNGIVLREEISTDALAYLQLAMDKLAEADRQGKGLVVMLLPLQDIMFSFWGCVDDKISDAEIRDIVILGKYVERLELYIRLKYRSPMVKKEFDRLSQILARIPENSPFRSSDEKVKYLAELVESYSSTKELDNPALYALGNLFTPEKVRWGA